MRCSGSAATTTAASSISIASTTAGSRVTGLIREALAAAYDLTGEERFLHAGLEGGSAWYRPSGGVTLSNDVAEWRGHLPFLGALDRAGLLQDLPSATVPAPAA